MRLLDLFCGRWGWSQAFAKRGWHCVGIDLVEPPSIPENCEFLCLDVLKLTPEFIRDGKFDFICASSPCEQFSVHNMKMFHPNPPYPELGLRLFNHTRMLCESSGLPYVMENVRVAERFVGVAENHCGPFYLWGNSVPPLLPQGIKKGFKLGSGSTAKKIKSTGNKVAWIEYRKNMDCWHSSKSPQRIANTIKFATIPQFLASCVVEYAERLIEQRNQCA